MTNVKTTTALNFNRLINTTGTKLAMNIYFEFYLLKVIAQLMKYSGKFSVKD